MLHMYVSPELLKYESEYNFCAISDNIFSEQTFLGTCNSSDQSIQPILNNPMYFWYVVILILGVEREIQTLQSEVGQGFATSFSLTDLFSFCELF